MAKRFELLIHQMLDDSDNYFRPTADAEPQLDQQVFAERLADAITLLSQPAVAQTEAVLVESLQRILELTEQPYNYTGRIQLCAKRALAAHAKTK